MGLQIAAKSGHPQLQSSLIQFQYHWIETVEEQFLGNLFEQRQEFDCDHFFSRGFSHGGVNFDPTKRCWSPPPKFQGPLVFTSALFPRFCGEISPPNLNVGPTNTPGHSGKASMGFLEVLIFPMYQIQFKGQWKKVPSASLLAADPFANVNGW